VRLTTERDRLRKTAASDSVGVAAMVDIQNLNLMAIVVNTVPDAILASPFPPQPVEWCPQWRTDPTRPSAQWTINELPCGNRGSRRTALTQRTPRTRSQHQPVRLRVPVTAWLPLLMLIVHEPSVAP
jgi:hypothetical protein